MNTAQQDVLAVLINHYQKARDVKISHRAHVVALFLKGYCVREIVEVTFHEESTVSRWIRAYQKHGLGSIFPGYYGNQNAAKLTQAQKQQVRLLLKRQPLSNHFWTIGKLKSYLSARFDIQYQSSQSYYALLKFCNYSYKLPSLFNIRRDDQQVKKRMQEIKKQIAPLMKDDLFVVLAADETRIEWSTLLRKAWLRRGRKTIIREKNEKRYQNLIGFLDLKTGQDHLFRLDRQDQEHILPVLIQLSKLFPGKKIVIVWDNAAFHRGKKIREQLGDGKPLENILLISLPPYAPDQNPQEWVWRYGKDQIANLVFNRFEILVSSFEAFITGRRYLYRI